MLPLAQYSLLEVSESVLLSTDTGTQEGTSSRATEAPTAEHDDDNSPGYTGTASYFLPKILLHIYPRRASLKYLI